MYYKNFIHFYLTKTTLNGELEILRRGTSCFMVHSDYNNNLTYSRSIAFCSPKERFIKKIGRNITQNILLNNKHEFIQGKLFLKRSEIKDAHFLQVLTKSEIKKYLKDKKEINKPNIFWIPFFSQNQIDISLKDDLMNTIHYLKKNSCPESITSIENEFLTKIIKQTKGKIKERINI